MASGPVSRPGAMCEDGAVDGILNFQRSKATENVSNKDNGDNDGSRDLNNYNSADMGSGGRKPNPINNGHSSASTRWPFQENRLPARDHSNGHSPMFSMPNNFSESSVTSIFTSNGRPMGFVDEIQDMSTTSPGDGLSSRPTPNSSSASESRQNLAPPHHHQQHQQHQQQQQQQQQQQPGGGAGANSGCLHSAGSSFDTSPVSPSHALGGGGGPPTSGVDRNPYFTTGPAGASADVGLNGAGGMSGLMGTDPSSGDYMIAEGWGINSQTAMTPVSEGVLRTIINMGPMETMDLSWGGNP